MLWSFLKINMKTESSKINTRSIGIFDSGLGGLTVLRELENILPNESFIYFGDTARVPYGNKSAENVKNYSKRIIKFLLEKDIKLAVVACNTSSALALSSLQNEFKIPIFGVIDAAVKNAEKASDLFQIGVIGTRATIQSMAYSKVFKKMGSNKSILEYACPLFVPLIEEGMLSGKIVSGIVEYYLIELKKNQIDTLILGCTHYPLLSEQIENYLGKKIKLISSGLVLAEEIKQFLKGSDMESKKRVRKTRFFVTDFPQKFEELSSRFLGREVKPISFTTLP